MKFLSVAVTGIVAAVAAFGGYRSQSSCVVGVRGTRATLTLHGFAAVSRCKGFADRNRDYYVRSETVSEPVLCEGERDGLHYTVRDEGLVVLVGRVLCERIKNDSSKMF